MTKYRIIPSVFWCLLSVFVMVFSHRLQLGSFQNPGPGFVPFLLGAVLLISSFYPIIKSFSKTKEAITPAKETQGPVNYRKMGFVLACLLGYALLFENLGFFVSTSAFLIMIFRGMGNRWASVLIGSAITILLTYFLFTSLGVRFPSGPW